MKLQPYHFITSPKPENEADLKDWQAKFGPKPEPEWKLFQDKCPEIGQIVVWGSVNYESYHYEGPFNKEDFEPGEKWYDPKDYKKRLKTWRDHRVKYNGFNSSGNFCALKK